MPTDRACFLYDRQCCLPLVQVVPDCSKRSIEIRLAQSFQRAMRLLNALAFVDPRTQSVGFALIGIGAEREILGLHRIDESTDKVPRCNF